LGGFGSRENFFYPTHNFIFACCNEIFVGFDGKFTSKVRLNQ